MRGLALTVAALVLVLAGCALRPRYGEFVTPQTVGPSVALQLVSADVPVAGATVEFGEYRNKVTLTTDAEGGFSLPVDKKYFADNPILVVNAPKGVGRTRVVAREPLRLLPVAPAEVEGSDAGTSTY